MPAHSPLFRRVPLVALLATAACATPYAYTFHAVGDGARPASAPGAREVVEDADVRAEILFDPATQHAILLDVTNKTDQVLQVEWSRISLTRTDGLRTRPRPDVDLGWIRPGETQTARLIPFVLPRSGDAALALRGQRFELEVPTIVRREPKRYRYTFSVQLQEL
jgi:hypothetical protein